jgi:hypothetical protein
MKFYHKDHEESGSGDSEFVKKQDKVRIIPQKKQQRITFSNFLNFFPPVELPFTITSDTQRLISLENDPLSVEWLFNFVLGKDEVIDEFTEFMPCFAIPNTHDFFAVVYWEAGIEGTTFNLVTYTKDGIIIDKNKIAGTKYDSDGLKQMVCTIGEDWMISSVEGRLDAKGNSIPVEENKTHHHTYLQLSSEGEIVTI